jgi:CRP/FNR family cyclic AMP-dependent transcriptional regulator
MDLAVDADGKLVIAEPMTQQDMASRVGCSREMVSRILKDLRVGGYITMDGTRLVITRKPPANW